MMIGNTPHDVARHLAERLRDRPPLPCSPAFVAYPVRWYTSRRNEVLAARVAQAAIRGAARYAEEEQAVFACHPAAASIDAVDLAYRRAGIVHPDSLFRSYAITAHHEAHPSFALRPNGVAEAALSAVYRGGSLAAFIAIQARDLRGRLRADALSYKAGQVLGGLVPVNAPAARLLEDTARHLEAMAGRRFREAAE